MAGISVSGIGSGLDINGLVTQLVAVERAPAQNQLDTQRSRVQSKISALGSLNSALDSLQTTFSALSDGRAFSKRTVNSRSAEQTSELHTLMRIYYAVICLIKT